MDMSSWTESSGQQGGAAASTGDARPPWLRHRFAGLSTCTLCSVLAVVAFFCFPYASLGFVSMTAPQAIALNVEYGNPVWGLVWIVPISCSLVALVGGLQRIGHRRPSSIERSTALCATVAWIVASIYVMNVFAFASNMGISVSTSTGLLGAGFWLGLGAMVGAGVGASTELSQVKAWRGLPGWR